MNKRRIITVAIVIGAIFIADIIIAALTKPLPPVNPAALETGLSCDYSDTSDHSDYSDTVIDLEAEWAALSRLAHAFAVVESNDNPAAYNKKENAVGWLQIRPCMVAEANRIVGEDIYTLSDRWDSITSIAIFHTVMMAKNPSLDVNKAIEIWNPNATTTYRHSILSNL